MNSTAEQAAEKLPRVKLVPLKSTWTCPQCERQNVYNPGICSDPQNKCFACGTEVTLGAIRSASSSDGELRKALEEIRDNDDECGCDHHKKVCAETEYVFCPRRVARTVLEEN